MGPKTYSLWIGEGKTLTQVVDEYDNIICMLHRPKDANDHWGMLNPNQSPEILLSVAAFLYDKAAEKQKLPPRLWGRTQVGPTNTVTVPIKSTQKQQDVIVPE